MSAQAFAVGHFRDHVEVVVTGPWTEQAAEPILSGEADRLVLNYAHGFAETDLEFLRELPLRQLVVLDRRLTSLAPLEGLSETLEFLHLTTDPKLSVDVAQFPRLVDLSADWQQVRSTVSAAVRLERLHIGRYSESDLKPLSGLGRLQRLALTDRPRLASLAGLEAFPDLRSLGGYLAGDLIDIAELGGRGLLEELELEGCRKLARIDAIAGCVRLSRLNLSECGDLASLRPLTGLAALEVVQLFGSTKVLDGDLAPLAGLPHLKELRMQSRRHYRPGVDDIQASLPRP